MKLVKNQTKVMCLIIILLVSVFSFYVIDSLNNVVDIYQKSNEQRLTDKIHTTDQIIQLTNQLADYKITAAQLQRLGATPEQAQDVIRAAEAYGLDPKF